VARPARLAIGAAAGALALSGIGAGALVGIGAALLLALLGTVGVARGHPRLAVRLRWWAPVVLGVVLIGLRAFLAGQPATSPQLPTGSGPWQAVVQSVGSPKAATRPAVLVLQLDETGGRTLLIAATLPWYPEVAAGDQVEVSGRVEARADGPYGDYLRRIGASGTLRATSLALAPGGSAGGWEGLRQAAAGALDRSIPAPEAGLAAGILVGLRDRVDRDLAAAFTTAGVTHIVAISGWNIAIVATTLGALTGRLRRRRRTVATALAVVLYVAFVGPSASVVRAAAMAGCALLARELGRPTTAAAAMGLAVTGLLVLDPSYVDDAGFRLSVLATAGLIAWGSRLSAHLAGTAPGRVRGWLAESLGVSLAAQAATLPVILLDFGRLSLVAPMVNLIVAPFVAPAMAAGALALGVGLVAGPMAAGLGGILVTLGGLPAWVLLGVIVGVVRIGAGLPFATVSLEPPFNLLGAVIAAVVIALAIRTIDRGRERAGDDGPAIPVSRSSVAATARAEPRAAGESAAAGSASRPAPGRRLARMTVGLVLGSVLAVGLAFSHRPDGATRITVLDVGQGDAILLEGGRGGRLLVDGGPDPGRLLVALDERLPPWDRRIDAVVLTHPHEDHVAGLALLLARYRIGRVFEPGMIGPGPGYGAWSAALGSGTAAASGPTRWALGTGDRLEVDDVQLEVLWPDPGAVPLHPADGGSAINNVSIVLLGSIAGHRFLLAGDIEQGIDPKLLARGLPTLDFLKVAHHGSGTASTEAFLETVRPRVAAVSVGAGNPYGHPAAATIDRLRRVAQAIYRTDLDGSVTVTFDGVAERVHATGRRAAVVEPNGGAPTRGVTLASAGGTPPAPIFSCGIPTSRSSPGITVVQPVVLAPPVAVMPRVPVTGSVLPHPPRLDDSAQVLRYHRLDDRSLPGGGDARAPLPRSPGLAPAPLARRRRGRRLGGAAHCGGHTEGACEPATRRSGRAPP
jgi:competence protein ComEC